MYYKKNEQDRKEGTRNQQKRKLRQRFTTLTDNDMTYDETWKDGMPGKLQIKPGKSKEEYLKLISGL